MLYAYQNKKLIKAKPKSKGICPHCNKEVVSKCGKINIWHWSHTQKTNCKAESKPESEWHINWKKLFGKEFCERQITKGDKCRFADIYTRKGVVIELQNSPISYNEIEEREKFYGEKMLWIINGDSFKNHFRFFDFDPIYSESLPLNFTFQENGTKGMGWYLDLKDQKPTKPLQLIMNDNDFDYLDQENKFYKFRLENHSWNKKIIQHIKSFNNVFLKKSLYEGIILFHWKHPIKSWKASKRHIFIDFSGNKLFWLKAGAGLNRGYGLEVTKDSFLKKYNS